jgi:K+-sensing histidine kinase KdpD
LKLSVKDNGEGIPADKTEVIFNRFMQADSSLIRSRQGCGIGLSLVDSFVKLLGGSIRVESEPGQGSEFYVELPLIEVPSGAVTLEQTGPDLESMVRIEFSDLELTAKAGAYPKKQRG